MDSIVTWGLGFGSATGEAVVEVRPGRRGPKGFQKAFGEAASLRKSPLRRVSRKASEKQLPSKSLLSEGFPESLRRSSSPQKVSYPKGFQKGFGEAASLKKSPLRRVSRKASEKQLPSESLLSEGFPESLQRISFPQTVSSSSDARLAKLCLYCVTPMPPTPPSLEAWRHVFGCQKLR